MTPKDLIVRLRNVARQLPLTVKDTLYRELWAISDELDAALREATPPKGETPLADALRELVERLQADANALRQIPFDAVMTEPGMLKRWGDLLVPVLEKAAAVLRFSEGRRTNDDDQDVTRVDTMGNATDSRTASTDTKGSAQ